MSNPQKPARIRTLDALGQLGGDRPATVDLAEAVWAIERADTLSLCVVLSRDGTVAALAADPKSARILLCIAARQESSDPLRALLHFIPAELVDHSGALATAADAGRLENLRLLLPSCDPDRQLEEGGRTALMCAVDRGNDSCVRALLPVSTLSVRADDGRDALMLAIDAGELKCAQLLAQRSDFSARDRSGRSALDHAIGRARHYNLSRSDLAALVDLIAGDGASSAHDRDRAVASFGVERLPKVLARSEKAAIAEALSTPTPQRGADLGEGHGASADNDSGDSASDGPDDAPDDSLFTPRAARLGRRL
ncbi:ankyrin repeat domain-containing protein [Burkholderia vietnamiensis]|uniref:Ankyrin n=1 Tax=Burkholderia vietnamiensis (strain G4 / LMG 22486) TaxID=269482 RepID=A4JFM9_BURVG|nr:Ankyrin [Burkholderia vietnamiensis G4]MCB4344843.1 ankyrin repeat domain-containing protein [Burkholderia vietnamiensis]